MALPDGGWGAPRRRHWRRRRPARYKRGRRRPLAAEVREGLGAVRGAHQLRWRAAWRWGAASRRRRPPACRHSGWRRRRGSPTAAATGAPPRLGRRCPAAVSGGVVAAVARHGQLSLCAARHPRSKDVGRHASWRSGLLLRALAHPPVLTFPPLVSFSSFLHFFFFLSLLRFAVPTPIPTDARVHAGPAPYPTATPTLAADTAAPRPN